jgi:hypothetical protein
MEISDSTNITGISKFLNFGSIDHTEDLEHNIIEENNVNTDVEDYKKQLDSLTKNIGINFDMDDEEPVQNVKTTNIKDDSDDERYIPKPTSQIGRLTEEQKKQKVLNHVLSDIGDSKFSIDKEKEEDDKAIMLEQIDMLILNLKDEGIDVSRIPEVNSHSSIEEVENVHKILRLKNDRNRYCSFAEECILAGSHALEWVFDGEKEYLGKKPDLRGWSATVNVKLRRMRFDTSTFVSDVMQGYNLGHCTRILLELIPSLFLYSKMKRRQHSDNLISSEEMNNALDKIRDLDEREDD